MAKKASEPTREYPFPSSEEAEAAVVASILMQPEWLDELDLDLTDFFLDEYKHLFQAELTLRERGEHIDEMSVIRETHGQVPAWVLPKIIAQVPTSLDCAYYALIVKDMSRRRALLTAAETLRKDAHNTDIPTGEILDKIRASLETLDFASRASRSVIFSNTRMLTSDPPTYTITVATRAGNPKADIKFSSAELDAPKVVKRKIRERLKINPILPKDFEGLINKIISGAQVVIAPRDASEEETVCFWIREWLKSAMPAEAIDDLAQGYIHRRGFYWFSQPRVSGFISNKLKRTLSPARLFQVLEPHGCAKDWVTSIGGKSAKLWGLPEAFFEQEAEEEVKEEQIPLAETKEGEDLSWLES